MSTRITDLPQAETLNGSEVMPLVQNGVTKHATLDFINQAAPAALILQQTQQAYANTVVLRDETEALKTEFEAQYLGSFPAPPVLNNDGSTLTTGAIYWNTSISSMYVWNGAEWTAFSSPSMRVHVQRFSGDGIQTDFLMTLGVSSASLVDVFINGIYQNKNTFTVEDTLISFSEPPPSGTENVEVLIAVATAIGETDASLVSYKVTDDSETVRTVQSKLREFVSVKDFGAVGDGVADDTAEVQAAVTHCFTAGDQLYWPDGTYLTTASITNFHAVRHVGPGAVQRGSNQYPISPTISQTQNLYVSSSGSAANDGLSSSQPMVSIQAAIDALAFSGRVVTNPCVIWCAAGTLTQTVSIPDGRFTSAGYLIIRGPSVATVQTPPTFTLNGTALSANAAIDCGRRNNVQIRDFLFTNWSTGTDAVQGGVGGLTWLYNCHSTDGNLRALLILDRAATGFVTGGIKTGGQYAFDVYAGSTLTLGYNSTSTADSSIVRNQTGAAVYCKSNVHVVANNCLFEDNALVVFGYHNSRFDNKGCDCRRNTRVYRMLASIVSEDIANPPTYNYGTPDANSVVWELWQHSAIDVTHNGFFGGLAFGQRTSAAALTGTISATLAKTIITVPAQLFATGLGRRIEVEGVVAGTGTGGTKTIQLLLGAAVVGTYTLASGSVTGKFRCVLWVNSGTNMIAVNEVSGSFTLVTPLRSIPVVNHAIDQDLSIWATIPGSGDTVTVHECTATYWG